MKNYIVKEEYVHEILILADRLFPHMPDRITFDLEDVIRNSNFEEEEKNELIYTNQTVPVLSVLLDFGYATESKDFNERGYCELTDMGRAVKKAGGHFAYQQIVGAGEIVEKKRQERKDKSDEFDLKIKNWTYKARYIPYIFSSLALIGTIISLSISIKTSNDKKAQPATQSSPAKSKVTQDSSTLATPAK
ncbi:MAG: hypothetical protein ABI707_20165 [Ferruginibacter sp.]